MQREEFDDVYFFKECPHPSYMPAYLSVSGCVSPKPHLCLLEGVFEDLPPLRETCSCHFRQEMASQGEVHFTVNLRVRARQKEEGGKEERREESSKGRNERNEGGR